MLALLCAVSACSGEIDRAFSARSAESDFGVGTGAGIGGGSGSDGVEPAPRDAQVPTPSER